MSDRYKKKKAEKVRENTYNNTQVFKDVRIYGNNSAININAIQTYKPTLISRYKDENTKQFIYRQTIDFKQKLLKGTLAIIFICILGLERRNSFVEIESWIYHSEIIYLAILNGLSLGIILYILFLWIDRKNIRVICNVDKALSSSFDRVIRFIEGTVYPLILLMITLVNLYFVFYKKYNSLDQNILCLSILILESVFCLYKIFNLVIFNNIYIEKVAIRDMITSCVILIVLLYNIYYEF